MADNTKLAEKLLLEGRCILVGEWRGAKPEEVPYVDKKDGQHKKFGKVTHVLEVGHGATFESLQVVEMAPKGVAVAQVPIPFAKGDRVLVDCRAIESDFSGRTVTAQGLVKI
jgi:hypothetical protein